MESRCEKYQKCDHDLREDLESFNEITIDRLSDNTLVKIFKSLPIIDRVRIERVCKRWKAVVKESWHDMKLEKNDKIWGFDISRKSHTDKCMIVEKVLQRCAYYVTHFEFVLNETIFNLVSEMCTNLESIDINYSYLRSDYDLYDELDPDNDVQSDDYLSKLFLKNKNLKHVKLFHAENINGECLLNLSKECVQTIIIYGLEYDNCISTDLFHAINHFENLETLSLRRLGIERYAVPPKPLIPLPKNIKNLDIEKYLYKFCDLQSITKLTKLKNLRVAGASVTDRLLFFLTRNCQNISILVMDDCKEITDSGLEFIAKLPSIEDLSIKRTKISDQGVKNLRTLKKLNCSMCSRVKDDGICTLLATSDSITELNLTCTGVTVRVAQEAVINSERRSKNDALHINLSCTRAYGSILTPSNLRLSMAKNKPNMDFFDFDMEWDSDYD